jgi:hypothetical protein
MKNKNKVKILLLLDMLLIIWLMLSIYQNKIRYDYDNFNCLNMSWEIKYTLDKYKIPCEVITGNHKNTNGVVFERHAWIRILGIDFESTLLCPFYPNTWIWNEEK